MAEKLDWWFISIAIV